MSDQGGSTTNFREVLAEERTYVDAWRGKTGRADARPLSGLALSGGGIRSAIFCLGVLQALANRGILKNFDYLSTVSGGGYIGSSLTWFTRAGGPYSVREGLPYGIDDPAGTPGTAPGTPLLAHLRRHGSYLNPGGTLSLAPGLAAVLRGVVLNLLVVWLPVLTTLFTIVRWSFALFAPELPLWPAWGPLIALAALIALAFGAMSVAYSIQSGWRAARQEDMPYGSRRRFERTATPVLIGLALTLLVGSLPFVCDKILQESASRGVVGMLMTALGSALGLWSRFVPKGTAAEKAPSWVGPIGAAFLAYGVALVAYALSDLFVDDLATLWPVVAAMLVLALVVAWFVNLNETTLHRFYRDRLMEAFMPDLGPENFPIRGAASVADASRLHAMCDPAEPKGPYHLICAHAVLTKFDGPDFRSSDKWRIRGGDSFVFSPRYCGGSCLGWHATGRTPAYSELSLPTAMAASGAAVNPNAASSGVGPQRNRLFAVLMALLNIRLGIWLPNPRKGGGKKHAAAPNHFVPGLASVLDQLGTESSFLEIADGGNFENLGVYELLRREVGVIVVCDATADPGSAFADLQNMVSRAEADFAATITFPTPVLKDLMPSSSPGRFPLAAPFANSPFVIGKVEYARTKKQGQILYIKPSIFEGLRLGLLGFKGAFPMFPDDSTVNQFFDEARFEAYRELGFACADKMLSNQAVLHQLGAM